MKAARLDSLTPFPLPPDFAMMRRKPWPAGPERKCARRGMTLIELLVAIAIVALLAGVAVSAFGPVRASADRAVAMKQMRQIGTALHQHAGEHHGRLPGPMWPGQIPVYDPDRDGRLARTLAPYLSVPTPPQPELVDLFVPPGFERAVGTGALMDSRTYVLNMFAPLPDGQVVNPWGNLAHEEPGSGRQLALLPGELWALSDADQLHPRVGSAPWGRNTPPEPIHGLNRLALLFSGSVIQIEDEELEIP